MKVLIIGNGITGVTAALELRRLKKDWRITLVSGESKYFYSRPALMYIFMGHLRFEDTKPYEDWFWGHHGIDRVFGWVKEIDTKQCKILMESGKALPFDKLLVATGSKPNKFGWPGQNFDRVQGFYNLQDLELLNKNRQGLKRAVIVGGGLIGLELAEMLHTRGVAVTMLARENKYWTNVMPEAEATIIGEVIKESGIDLRLKEELAEIIDDGKGQACAIKLKSGEKIECQLVGLTAGVSPNLSALVGSEIQTGRGVLVDDQFRTNIECVYSAGDCAEVVTPEGERNRIEQLWYTGKMQGEVVGKLLAGEKAVYDRGVWYNSAKFVDLEWHTYGQVPSGSVDSDPPPSRALYWEAPTKRHSMRIVHNNGKVIGFNSLGIRYRHRVWEKWIGEGYTVDQVIKHLGEGNFDPEFFYRFESEIVASFKEQLS